MQDYYKHISDYLEGSLNEETRKEFEQAILTDPSLRLAVDNYWDAKKLSEGLLEMDMMETINRLKADSKNAGEADNVNRNFWMWFGIVVSILAIIAIWWFNQEHTGLNGSMLNKNQILANYIRPVDTDATKSVDTVGMTAFQKGKYFFALNQFEESEQWLKIFIRDENEKNQLSKGYFWLGAAHLEQWEVQEAQDMWSKSDEQGAKQNILLIIKN